MTVRSDKPTAAAARVLDAAARGVLFRRDSFTGTRALYWAYTTDGTKVTDRVVRTCFNRGWLFYDPANRHRLDPAWSITDAGRAVLTLVTPAGA